MNEILVTLKSYIVSGKRKKAIASTEDALKAEVSPKEILDALISGMDDVGERFSKGEMFVPEVLMCARSMKESIELIEPLLVASGIRPDYTIVIGTVEGDLHDIGKNLVGMMFKGANFKVVDLGSNVSPQAFLDATKEHDADIVGMSAMLTTTMPVMKTTVDLFRKSGMTKAKLIIGGSPVTPEYKEQIGADGYSPDAAAAVALAKRLLGVTAA